MENKPAKLEKVEVKNFGKYEHIEIVFKGNVTRLVANNGQGKTTIGQNAIIAALNGIAKKGNALIGNRYQFIGNHGKSADAIIQIKDVNANAIIECSNHITKGANEYSFILKSGPKGYIVDEQWLKNLINAPFLSANTFCNLSPKEQSLALGIDVRVIDAEIAQIKTAYTLLNRELKTHGELDIVEKTEKVSLSDLYKRRQTIVDENQIQKDLATRRQTLAENLREAKTKQLEVAATQARLIEKSNEIVKAIKNLPPNAAIKSVEEIDGKILSADIINEKALAYEKYNEKEVAKAAVNVKIETNRKALATKNETRTAQIQKAKLPFTNFTINDDGELLLNDRYINMNTYSTGEREMIVASIAAAMNPDWKTRFIDDFDLLDEENQNKLIESLTAKGFELIVACVNPAQGEHDDALILKDGKIIE